MDEDVGTTERRFAKVLTASSLSAINSSNIPFKNSDGAIACKGDVRSAEDGTAKLPSAPLTAIAASDALLKPTKSSLARSANKENNSPTKPHHTPSKKRGLSTKENSSSKAGATRGESLGSTGSDNASHNTFEVDFPAGSMGLELEPVLISSERQIGCRVKDYYFGVDHSGIERGYVLNTIQIGDIIISIDNDNIQTSKFLDILNILKLRRNDPSRKVVFKRLLTMNIEQAASVSDKAAISSDDNKSNSSAATQLPTPRKRSNSNPISNTNTPLGKDTSGIEISGNGNLIDSFLPVYSKNEMNRREAKSNTILNELSQSVYDYKSLEANYNDLLKNHNKLLEGSKLTVNGSKERISTLSQELAIVRETNKKCNDTLKNEILLLKNEWKSEKDKLECIINDLSSRNFELENRSDPLVFTGPKIEPIAVGSQEIKISNSNMLSCLLNQKEGEILEIINEKNNLLNIIASKNSIIDQLNNTNNVLRDNSHSNKSKIESLINSLDNKESTIIKLNADISNNKHLIDVLNTKFLHQSSTGDCGSTSNATDSVSTTPHTEHSISSSCSSSINQLITNNYYNNYLNKIESLNFEVIEMREKSSNYEKNLIDINKILCEKKDLIKRLKNDIIVKSELYANVANEKFDLESRAKELSALNNNLHIDLNNKDILIDNYLADITEKDKLINVFSSEKDAAIRENEELKSVVHGMLLEGAKIKQVLDVNSHSISLLDSEISVLKETINAKQVIITGLECDAEEKKTQILRLSEEIVDKSATISALRGIESSSKNEKEQFLIAIQQNNEIHSKLIDGLKQEISERNIAIEKYNNEISNLKVEIEKRDCIVANNKSLTESNSLFKQNIILLEIENKQYKSSIEALECNHRILISENSTLRDENIAAGNIMTSLERNKSDILAAYNDKLRGLTHLIAAMKAEQKSVKDEFQQLFEVHSAIQKEQKQYVLEQNDKISELSIKNYNLYENENKLLLEMRENQEKIESLEKRFTELLSKSVNSEKRLIEKSKEHDIFANEASKKNNISNQLIASLKDEIDIKDNNLNSLTEKYHSLNTEFHFNKTKYEIDISNLQSHFADELNDMKLNNSKDISKHEIDLINRINNRRIEHEEELNKVQKNCESKISELQQNYNSILFSLKNEITDLNAIIVNYKIDNDNLHNDNLELQLTTKNSIQMMSDIKINSLNTEVTINSLNEEIIFLRSKLIDGNAPQNSNSNFIGNESDNMMCIKSLQTGNSLNKITIDSLTSELQQTKNMYKENYLNLQKAKRNEENLQTEKLILMNEINSYKNSLELSEKTINKLSRDILSTQSEYESMKANERQSSNKLLTCEIELIDMKESFEDISNKYVFLEKCKNSLNSEVAKLKNELSEMHAKYSLLQACANSSANSSISRDDVHYPKEKINELITTIFLQKSCLDECEKRDVEYTEQLTKYQTIISNLEQRGVTDPATLSNENMDFWLLEAESNINNLNESLLNGILMYNDIIRDGSTANLGDNGSNFLCRHAESSSFVNVSNIGNIKRKMKGLSQFFTEFSDKIHKTYLFINKNPFAEVKKNGAMDSTFLPAHIFAASFYSSKTEGVSSNASRTARAGASTKGASRAVDDAVETDWSGRSPPCPVAKQLSMQVCGDDVKLKPIPFIVNISEKG